MRSRGLGDVYKRQVVDFGRCLVSQSGIGVIVFGPVSTAVGIYFTDGAELITVKTCLLYTSDAADERSSVDLGGRRIIKKKNDKQL